MNQESDFERFLAWILEVYLIFIAFCNSDICLSHQNILDESKTTKSSEQRKEQEGSMVQYKKKAENRDWYK